MLCAPPFVKTRSDIMSSVVFLPGIKENAGTWSFYAITQYMLGIKPQYDGLLIDPCIKHDWDGYTVERV